MHAYDNPPYQNTLIGQRRSCFFASVRIYSDPLNMKIAIGVTTFNRRDLVRINAQSLSRARLPPNASLLVVDDASTEYGIDFLEEVYPRQAVVHRREKNSGGADYAGCDMLGRLVATGADALLLLDSDMIVATDFADKIFEYLPKTNGILSLFNTPAHPTLETRGPIVVKRYVGCTGTVWPRELARKMLAAVPSGERWDWRFCDFLVESGHEIHALQNSAVQHIGINIGHNTPAPLSGDIGTGFLDEDTRSAYAILEQIGLGSQAAIKALRADLDRIALGLDAPAQIHSQKIKQLFEAHENIVTRLEAIEARLDYLNKRSLIEVFLFRKDGRPVKALRRLLFHKSGAPRAGLRFIVLHRDGTPRRAFSYWLNTRDIPWPAR